MGGFANPMMGMMPDMSMLQAMPQGAMNPAMGIGGVPELQVPKINPGPYGPNSRTYRDMIMQGRLMRMARMGMGGAGRASYGRGGMGPMDLSQGGMDPGAMQAAAMSAGMSPEMFNSLMPQNPSPNAIFHTGWNEAHPRITGAIEGALLGAANTAPSMTVGEGISNAIRGGLAGNAERSRMVNQQFTAPFQTALQMAGLQKELYASSAERERARLYGAQADYQEQRPQLEQEKLDFQGDKNAWLQQFNQQKQDDLQDIRNQRQTLSEQTANQRATEANSKLDIMNSRLGLSQQSVDLANQRLALAQDKQARADAPKYTQDPEEFRTHFQGQFDKLETANSAKQKAILQKYGAYGNSTSATANAKANGPAIKAELDAQNQTHTANKEGLQRTMEAEGQRYNWGNSSPGPTPGGAMQNKPTQKVLKWNPATQRAE